MNKHTTALIIKFILISLVFAVLLPIFGQFTIGQAISTALVLTLISYLLGDLGILPRTDNMTAVISDAIIAAIVIAIADWTVNGIITLNPIGWILTLGLLAVGEWFFHKYIHETPVKPGGIQEETH